MPPTSRPRPSQSQENVAAALDQIDAASASSSKANAIVRRRIEELEEALTAAAELQKKTDADADKKEQQMRETYTRDTTALQTRLTNAEEKLRKVQATLA